MVTHICKVSTLIDTKDYYIGLTHHTAYVLLKSLQSSHNPNFEVIRRNISGCNRGITAPSYFYVEGRR